MEEYQEKVGGKAFWGPDQYLVNESPNTLV